MWSTALLVLLATDVAQAHVVAVAGATGRVGQLVVRELLSQGHKVRALTRNEDKAKEALPAEVERCLIDFASATHSDVAAALGSDTDRFIWCASGFTDNVGILSAGYGSIGHYVWLPVHGNIHGDHQ